MGSGRKVGSETKLSYVGSLCTHGAFGLLYGGSAQIVPVKSPRVRSTYIVESKVSIVGIPIMFWVSIPYIGP